MTSLDSDFSSLLQGHFLLGHIILLTLGNVGSSTVYLLIISL